MDQDLHFSSEPEREGFEALLSKYVNELPTRVSELVEAQRTADVDRTIGLLHQLAGSLGLYGYRRLEGLCRAQLARLRQGDGLDATRAGLDHLSEELSRVRARPAL